MQDQLLRVRGWRATRAAGRSATGHPDRQCALRRRLARRRVFGGAAATAQEGVWPARRSSHRLTWREAEAQPEQRGQRPGASATRSESQRGGGLGGSPRPRDRNPRRRPHDRLVTARGSRQTRYGPGSGGALLPQPEPRRPLPVPRASSPGPAAGSSIRCSAEAAAIPRAAAAAAPICPGGAAHPPFLPRSVCRGSAPGPRPKHRPVQPQPSPRRMERRRRPHAPPPAPPKIALRDLSSRSLSFSARRRYRGCPREGSELVPPRPPGLGEESRPSEGARRAGGAEPRSRTKRARSRRPCAQRRRGLPSARPANRSSAGLSPTAAWRGCLRRAPQSLRLRPPEGGAASGLKMGQGGVGRQTGGHLLPTRGPLR